MPCQIVTRLPFQWYHSKIFLFLQHSQGFQIRDLYTNDETFITDADFWTETALRNGIPYSTCDGTYLVGGFDVLGFPGTVGAAEGYYFQRIYNNLPDHNIIYFTISLWLLDSWDANPPDYFWFEFDSKLVEGWTFGNGNFTSSSCGNPIWPDLKNMTVFGQVSHSGPSLTLRIITHFDDYAIDESLGFRDVNLIFAGSIENNVNQMCGLSPLPLPSNQCSCSYGEYFDEVYTFGCALCDPSCRSCFGGTPQECYECQVGYSFVDSECIKCDESCAVCSGPKANECIDCPEGMSLFDDGTCAPGCVITYIAGTVLVCDQPCETGQFYFSENKTCSDECNLPWIVDPFLTSAQVCAHPCPGGYVYWDGTCNSECPFPLKVINLDYEVSLCDFTCGINEVLYWDGSCNETCDGGLILSFYKDSPFCQHPCAESTDFIYWNGSCRSDCPSPYVGSSDGKAYYCSLPCSEEQPYWNGSACLDFCSVPFQVTEEDGILYCRYLCSSSEYLHWDGTCIDSCPTPYEVCAIGPGMQFCSYLCKQYGEYYYPKDGQCLPTCDGLYHPEIQISLDGAWYVACVEGITGKQPGGSNAENDEEEESRGPLYYPITAVKVASEKVAGVFMALDIVVSLLRDSHVMILILVLKILNFVKYVDIKVPPQLVQEFHTFDNNHFYLNFGPGMSEGMRERFTKEDLPMVFERAGLHSRFLVNFFKPITSFLIMLGLMGMIGVLQRFLRGKASNQDALVKMILRRLEVFVKWNLVVFLGVCNVDEMILYGIIEWKTVSFDSAQDIISFIISLGMAIVSLCVLVAPLYFLHKIFKTRFKVLSNQANEPYFGLLKKLERFQLLWKDFRDSSWPQKAFLSIYILRIAVIYMIIGLLYKRPLLQMVLIFSISLGMLTFMSIVKPFMKKLDFIQSVLYEVLMLISIGSMLILAALDRARAKADQLWIFLGDCIMFCQIWICLTGVLFFVYRFFLEMQGVWRFYKTVSKPISWREFVILFLKDDDPVIQELKKNKRTSTKLDLTSLEREIERKNFAKYNIELPPADAQAGSENDGTQPNYIPRKGELRIRRSLFGLKLQSSDLEDSPFKTNSTLLNEIQSPSFPAALIENLKLSNRVKILNEIKKNLQDISPSAKAESREKKNSELQNNEEDSPNRRKFSWKGLETIKELDSMEVLDMKSGQQSKRFRNLMYETFRGDLSLLSVVNKRLSSETLHKAEEVEILKEKADSIKKRMATKEQIPCRDSVFA